MNHESRTTTSLDSILEGDKEEWDVSMSVRVACLRRATCPGCSYCNDQTLASRHSATRIDDMAKSRQQYPRVVSDEANGYTTVYKRKPPQVQKNPGSHTLDMNLSRMQNARVREDEANGYATVYKVNISQMESDAALARQLYQEDELVADMRSSVIEESDAALARQLYHDDLVAKSDAALARQLNQDDQYDDLLADMRAFAIEETDAALARQLSQDELFADMLMEESDAALARQIEESDAALVRQRILREESASALALAWHNMPRREGI